MTENSTDKAKRLLVEGRLTVLRTGGTTGIIHAKCKGDSGEMYDLGYDPTKKQWRCNCVARGRCSHIKALQLVTTIERR